jgi:hypothetical protein
VCLSQSSRPGGWPHRVEGSVERSKLGADHSVSDSVCSGIAGSDMLICIPKSLVRLLEPERLALGVLVGGIQKGGRRSAVAWGIATLPHELGHCMGCCSRYVHKECAQELWVLSKQGWPA